MRTSLKLLARGDQSLMVSMVSEEFLDLVLDLGLDMVNGVGYLDLQGDDFGRRRLVLDIVNGVRCLDA